MPVHHVHAWCPERPEEDIRPLESGVADGSGIMEKPMISEVGPFCFPMWPEDGRWLSSSHPDPPHQAGTVEVPSFVD